MKKIEKSNIEEEEEEIEKEDKKRKVQPSTMQEAIDTILEQASEAHNKLDTILEKLERIIKDLEW